MNHQETVDTILALAGDILRLPKIDQDVDLFDQGATSLSVVRILLAVNGHFGTKLSGADLNGDGSVANIARLVLLRAAPPRPTAPVEASA